MNILAQPRLVGALIGDIAREPGAQVKYGFFFSALGQRFPIVDVFDASLRGIDRIFNLLMTLHPQKRVWKERFYKNLPAFEARSRLIAGRIIKVQSEADLILQHGVLFQSQGPGVRLPVVIYTDFTAQLAAEKPELGRSPFTPAQRRKWIEQERQAFSDAVHICTRSKFVFQSILEDYGIPSERISVVGGGVNFAALPEAASYNLEDVPTALFIGKDFYRKGGDILLRAFARVRSELPSARLLFLTADHVPAGLPLDGVELVKPTWNRKVIAALFRQAQVFVLPSRLETWGDVLLEAMSYGLPCIGVAGQAMEELIHHCHTGLILPANDEQALAEALVLLFTKPELRQAWGQAARRRVEQEFTWEQVVNRLEPVLIEAASTHRAKVR
jgi:glycosyltransferase involved in cell wall biosynthesis